MKRALKIASVASLALAIVLPSAASAYRASNALRVNPEGPVTFEVIQRGGISAADAWCAAGDYAVSQLRAAATQRIYLVEGKHIARTEERRRFGYTFSLTPPPEAANFTSSPLTLSLRNIGDSLRVASARQYCDERLGNDEWEFG